jgi:hypothetical protein
LGIDLHNIQGRFSAYCGSAWHLGAEETCGTYDSTATQAPDLFYCVYPSIGPHELLHNTLAVHQYEEGIGVFNATLGDSTIPFGNAPTLGCLDKPPQYLSRRTW